MLLVCLAALGLAVGFGLGRAPLPIAAGLVGVLAMYALLREPRLGVYGAALVIVLLPFAVVPLPWDGVQFTFLDVTLTLAILLWWLRLLFSPNQRLHITHVGGLVLVYLSITVIALVYSLGYGISLSNLRLFARSLLSAGVFFYLLNNLLSLREVRWLVLVVVGGGAVAAVLGIGVYLLPAERAITVLSALGPLGYPTGADVLRYLAESDRIRAVGTAIDPNFFGAVLMICAVLASSQAIAERPIAPRLFLSLALVPMGAALLLSLSRSSWVGYAGALAFVATVRYRWLWLLLMAGGLALLSGALPGTSSFAAHLWAGFLAQDKATLMRLGEYKDALNLIGTYPWLGVGYGNAPSVDTYIGVSSVYFLLAENAGLVGVGAYLLAMAGVFFYCLPAARRAQDPLASGLVLSCLACLFGALVAGIFDHHFVNIRVPHILALFWLCAGLAVSLSRAEREGGRLYG